MKLFFDTNIFLRFFTKDNEEMYSLSSALLSLAEEGKIQVSTSTIVLVEIIYTLKSFYRQNNQSVQKHVDSILKVKNLYLIDNTKFRKAYGLLKKSGNKISDCLIVTQIPENYKLCSFDERLKKLIGEKRFVHPKDALKHLKTN